MTAELRTIYRKDGPAATLVQMKNLKEGDVFSFGDKPLEFWRAAGAPYRVALDGHPLSLISYVCGTYTWAINADRCDS